jgi:hypothetical protein
MKVEESLVRQADYSSLYIGLFRPALNANLSLGVGLYSRLSGQPALVYASAALACGQTQLCGAVKLHRPEPPCPPRHIWQQYKAVKLAHFSIGGLVVGRQHQAHILEFVVCFGHGDKEKTYSFPVR